MNRKTLAIALIAGSLAIGGAAAASDRHAQVDSRSAADALPVATVLEQLAQQGYRDFTDVELEHGKYEIDGRDAEDRKVEIDVDARTGAILKVERD